MQLEGRYEEYDLECYFEGEAVGTNSYQDLIKTIIKSYKIDVGILKSPVGKTIN